MLSGLSSVHKGGRGQTAIRRLVDLCGHGRPMSQHIHNVAFSWRAETQ